MEIFLLSINILTTIGTIFSVILFVRFLKLKNEISNLSSKCNDLSEENSKIIGITNSLIDKLSDIRIKKFMQVD